MPGYPDDYGKTSAIQDVENPALVCGRDAFASAPKTDTADVIAGETVGFRLMRVPIEGGVSWSLLIFQPAADPTGCLGRILAPVLQ